MTHKLGRVLGTTAGTIAALVLLSGTARADQDEPAADEGKQTPGRPLPRDDRKGHFSAFGAFDVTVPGGDLGAGITLAQVVNAGIGGEAGIAMGLSRYSGLELRGQFIKFSASRECPTCQAEMFAGTLGLTYHTSQALGFDPWVRFGAGFRSFTVDGVNESIAKRALQATNATNEFPLNGAYHGIDVASFSMGGDYFPVPWFGIGLFLSGDVGVQLTAPSERERGAVYGYFQAGFRIALEPQRKPVTVAQAAPREQTALVGRFDFSPSLYNRGAR